MTETATGTTPRGTRGETQAAEWVQKMFSDIAPKYDFLNHLLSFNIDRGWRKALLRRLMPVLSRPDATILDLCCGTGDVLLDLRGAGPGQLLGADFCHPMLVAAKKKSAQKNHRVALFEADALNLPVADRGLDAISIAFGFRNLSNYTAGLAELRRVLKPRGMLAILEFSHPRAAIVKTAYGFYSRAVLPTIGRIVSGSREAYSYLPESIEKFPPAEELQALMEQSGFENVQFELLSGGIAALHCGQRA